MDGPTDGSFRVERGIRRRGQEQNTLGRGQLASPGVVPGHDKRKPSLPEGAFGPHRGVSGTVDSRNSQQDERCENGKHDEQLDDRETIVKPRA